MSNDSTKPAAGKPHQTSPGTSGPIAIRSRRGVGHPSAGSPKLGAGDSGTTRGDAGSAVADLVPGGRGAEKPRVFLWEAAAAAVRVVGTADAPWFVAKDVCAALGIANYRDALASLEEDEKGVALTDTLGGAQEMLTVNESGLYALIFRSRKEQARIFRKWVTSEVLPQIRKTGRYAPAIADQWPKMAPHPIEIRYHPLPAAPVPTEEEAVVQLLGGLIGLGRKAVVVHGSTIYDTAVRDGILLDWIGTHRIEWQRRGRFLHRLRAYFGRWLHRGDSHTYFSVTPHGLGRSRRYHICERYEKPADSHQHVSVPEAVRIVDRALATGGEVIDRKSVV